MPYQQPKRPISELEPAELRTILGEIQKLVFWDMKGGSEFWSNQKQLSLDTLDQIAGVLQDHGLEPIDLPTITGTVVDEFTRHMAENFTLPDPPNNDANDGFEV